MVHWYNWYYIGNMYHPTVPLTMRLPYVIAIFLLTLAFIIWAGGWEKDDGLEP